LTSYRQYDRPRQPHRSKLDSDTEEALQHVRDVELFIGESAEGGQFESQGPAEDGKEVELEIDARLQELAPFDQYSETLTQHDLTSAEGEVIDRLLGLSEEPETVQPRDTVEVLDSILEVAPQVREIYARALKLPSANDHDDCRQLLLRLGVPILTAMVPYEAEGLASSLARQGLVDFVATEDSDVLAYEVGYIWPSRRPC
jgi:flap endonuclease-1